jgi:hypothetical protein
MIFLSNNGLARLQLDGSATERDVKKAYARELKLIDPATQPQAFAELREAYESALAQVRFTAQFSGESEPAGRTDEAGASGQGREESGGDTPAPQPAEAAEGHPEEAEEPRRAQPEPAFIDTAAEKPAPRSTPESSPPPSHLPFERFVEALTFPSSDLPAAQAMLRHWLAQDGLMLMAAREAFELELMEALASRRFGQRTAVVFLAASQAFHWNSGRHGLLERTGPNGAYISSLLYEMAVLDGTSQSRWLALTGTPDPKKALTLLKDAERMESLSPVLARLFFADGHIAAWHQARDHAPVLLRGFKRAITVYKNSALLRGMLYLLVLPVIVVSIMAAALSLAQFKEANQASSLCDGYFASAMAKGWKDIPLSDITQLENCARGIPPLLCSDRAALLDVMGMAKSVQGSHLYYFSRNGMLVNLSDGRRFGAATPADCSAVMSFATFTPWLGQGDEKAARQLVADIAKCVTSRGDSMESPALLALLAQTDAWPAPPSGRAGKPAALGLLVSQPVTAPFTVTPHKPWPACVAVMNEDLRSRMGEKEGLAASIRANYSAIQQLPTVLKTPPGKAGPQSAAADAAVAAAAAR